MAIETPPDPAKQPSTIAKIAAGAASGATAGTFSYVLFDKMGIAGLMQQGTVYGLTAFAIVAVIVILGGYAALPNKDNDFVRSTARSILFLFAGLSIAGFGFIAVTQAIAGPVIINATISQDLTDLNRQFGLNDQSALSAKLDDLHGPPKALKYETEVPFQVANNSILELRLENIAKLGDVLRQRTDQAALKAQCANGACDLSPSGGDAAHAP